MRGEKGGEERGGLSVNVAEEAFCLKSTPAFRKVFDQSSQEVADIIFEMFDRGALAEE